MDNFAMDDIAMDDFTKGNFAKDDFAMDSFVNDNFLKDRRETQGDPSLPVDLLGLVQCQPSIGRREFRAQHHFAIRYVH